MNARDKEIRNELIMKLKKAKKILWLKNKETIQQKKTHTSKFIEKLLDKNNANETDKQEYKSLFDKWSSETMGCYQVEIPEFLQCKITFVISFCN